MVEARRMQPSSGSDSPLATESVKHQYLRNLPFYCRVCCRVFTVSTCNRAVSLTLHNGWDACTVHSYVQTSKNANRVLLQRTEVFEWQKGM